MKFIGLVIFANTLGLIMAKDCKTTYGGKTCVKRDQLLPWQQAHVNDGDPCFTHNSRRMCFTAKGNGMLSPCKCDPECGCGPALPPPPKCDNSRVPKSFKKMCKKGYGKENTMCIYNGIGPKCGPICNRQLTQKEKDQILEKHNELRRKVAKGQQPGQPSAANMKELKWDKDLERSAQRWADQCVPGHDKVRSTRRYKKVGQNTAQFGSSANSAANNVQQFVQNWFNEVKDFRSGPDSLTLGRPNTGVIGHYTALVWAETEAVGCGFVHYKGEKWIEKVLVCNYGPAGNLIGSPLYKRGPPGSDCKKNNDGLCA